MGALLRRRSAGDTDRLRRVLGITATVLLLATAVAFFLVTPRQGGSDPGAAAPVGSPSARSSGPSSGASGSARPTSPAPSSGAPTGAAGVSPVGPGTTEPGVSLVASPRSDGRWDVVERIRLASPDTTLSLAVPQIDRLGGDFARSEARIQDLQASADDQAVLLDRRSDGWEVQASTPGRDFQLRYVLSGATVRSVPSTAGRALTALAPLSSPSGSADRVQVTAVGADVHSLQCPLRSGDGQLCEQSNADGRLTTRVVPGDEALVLVQFDLPAPQ